MTRKKLAVAITLLCGLMLTGNSGIALVQAASATSGKYQAIDPILRKQNRLKHANRKAAAKRLQAKYQQVRKKQLFNQDGTPKGASKYGYTGNGRQGGSL